MIKRSVQILYIGAAEKGRLLGKHACHRGWLVHQPAEVMEALALHIMLYPDIVVLDRHETPLLAAEVEAHLRSLDDGTLLLDGTFYEIEPLLAAIEDKFKAWTTDFCENGC